MRAVLFVFSFLVSVFLLGQQKSKQNQIFINDNMFIMLNFPSKIEFHKISVATEENIGISINGETMYIQALTDDLPKSNLMVQTADGVFYSFIIAYKKDIKEDELAYFFTLNHAINSKDSSLLNDTKKFESTNSMNLDQSIPLKASKDVSNLPVIERIYNEKGFIKSRNVTKNQGIIAALTGVYIVKEKIYVQFSLANETNIDYDIDSFLFTIENRKDKNKVSEQVLDLEPIQVYKKISRLSKKSKGEIIVFEFDKLTIDRYKVLRFEMIENKGERNLSYNISNDILKDARLLD